MAIAVVGTTTTFASSSTTTDVTPATPDGSSSDELLWIGVWGHSAASSIANRPTPNGGRSGDSSFAHIGSKWGGGGTFGSQAGPRGLSFWKGLATSATGAVDDTNFTPAAAGVVGVLAVRLSKAAGKILQYTLTTAEDTNSADGWAPAGYTDIGAAAGDLILHACSIPQTAINPTIILAWPGLTLGTESNVKTGNINVGQQVRGNVRQRAVSSGTNSGAPTTTVATTGMTGVHGILRIREVDPPPTSGWQVGSYSMGH